MYNFNQKKSQHGVTLIELLIALALGVIVILGVTQGLISLTNSSRVQTNNANLQENGDAALSYIAFKIRNSLASPCERFAILKSYSPSKITIHNLAGTRNYKQDGKTKSESIDSAFSNSVKKIIDGPGIFVASIPLPNKVGNVNNPTSDALMMMSTKERLFTTTDINLGSESVTIGGKFDYDGGSAKTFYAVTDCTHMDLFRASPSETGKNTTLNFSRGQFTKTYRTGSTMITPVDFSGIQVNNNSQLIDSSAFANNFGPLMNDVELMRVVFSVDNDSDGIADKIITAQEVSNLLAAAFNGANINDSVISANIYLLVKLPQSDSIISDNYTLKLPITNSAISKNMMQTFTFTDRVPRKVFVRSVTLRNNAITL